MADERYQGQAQAPAAYASLVTGQRIDAYYVANEPERVACPSLTSWDVAGW